MDGAYTGTLTRGQKLWNTLRDRRDTEPLSLERAKLVTESYQETTILPIILRRGEALKKILNNIPIYLDDGQLLAGDYGARPMAAEWFPEFSVEWVAKEIMDGHSPYAFDSDSTEVMREICEFWKDKAAKETFYAYMGPDVMKRLYEYNEHGSWIFAGSMEAQTEKGWHIPDYAKVIRCGLRGILNEIEAEQSALRVRSNEDLHKDYLLRAMKTALEAVISYAHRYAELAETLAQQESDPVRRAELQQIARNCLQVPEHFTKPCSPCGSAIAPPSGTPEPWVFPLAGWTNICGRCTRRMWRQGVWTERWQPRSWSASGSRCLPCATLTTPMCGRPLPARPSSTTSPWAAS